MVDNSNIFVEFDLNVIIKRLLDGKNKFENIDDYVVHLLKYVDPNGNNYVSLSDIENGLKKLDIYLSKQELSSLSLALKKNENGLYSMESLFDLIKQY